MRLVAAEARLNTAVHTVNLSFPAATPTTLYLRDRVDRQHNDRDRDRHILKQVSINNREPLLIHIRVINFSILINFKVQSVNGRLLSGGQDGLITSTRQRNVRDHEMERGIDPGRGTRGFSISKDPWRGLELHGLHK